MYRKTEGWSPFIHSKLYASVKLGNYTGCYLYLLRKLTIERHIELLLKSRKGNCRTSAVIQKTRNIYFIFLFAYISKIILMFLLLLLGLESLKGLRVELWLFCICQIWRDKSQKQNDENFFVVNLKFRFVLANGFQIRSNFSNSTTLWNLDLY